jgi:hypothetical protein
MLGPQTFGRRTTLDEALAEGVPIGSDAALRARAKELTRARTRRSVADMIEAVVETAERPPTSALSSSIPVRRQDVLDARPALLMLAQRLRDPGPPAARGVAMARVLLTHAESPLYERSEPDALIRAAQAATAALDDRDW